MASAVLVIGALAAAVLAASGLVHVYWACGGHLGHGAAVPVRDGRALFRPGRAGTLGVAAALIAAAALVALRSGLVALPGIPLPGLDCLIAPAASVLALISVAPPTPDL